VVVVGYYLFRYGNMMASCLLISLVECHIELEQARTVDKNLIGVSLIPNLNKRKWLRQLPLLAR
jgi:hypothetical protein